MNPPPAQNQEMMTAHTLDWRPIPETGKSQWRALTDAFDGAFERAVWKDRAPTIRKGTIANRAESRYIFRTDL